MKRSLLVACVALSLASTAYGQDATVSETIPVRYLTATSISTVVKTVSGIDPLIFNRQDNSVTVHGSRKAVDAFKAELRTADVPAVTYRISMRLVRYDVDKQGQCVETVIMEPTILDMNKFPATCSIMQAENGFTLSVTPRQAGSKSVQLTMEVHEQVGAGQVVLSGKNVRRVKLGETVRIVGMTNAADNSLHRAAQRGEIITNRGEYTGYYVEVKPTLEAPTGAPKS